MCWGVPAKVIKVEGLMAKVDFGGSIKDVLVINEDVKPGDLVIVHAGTIIGKIDEKEIDETIGVYGDLMKDSLMDDGVDPEEADRMVKEWISKLVEDEKNG